ncbi:MAG: 6-bladed beta-propeller [Gemmatimonadetes bacterium]|nr:6-bladed beta-propeller [Gemmatimonadota bacterium]
MNANNEVFVTRSPWSGTVPAVLLVVIQSAVLGSQAAAQVRGPDLVLLDSLILEETEDHYLGQPLGLLVRADGSLLVSDGFSDAVLQYDSAGRLVGNLGRKGSGPGEFRNLGGVGFTEGTVVGFLDEVGKIEVFSAISRVHLGNIRLDFDHRPASFSILRDSLWFAGVNPKSGRTLGVVALSQLVDAASDGGTTGLLELTRGSAPVPYTVDHPLAFSLAHAFVDVGDDDVLLAYAATPFVLRVDRSGVVRDTVWIAQGTRRGEMAEPKLLAMMQESGQPQSREELRTTMFGFYGSVSFVRGVSRDGDGNIYTIHQDSNRDDDANMTAVSLYAAVSDPRGALQCADTLIPTSGIGVPIPLLAAETLWILDQRMQGDATTDVVTVVRQFKIDATRCTGAAR